MRVFHLLLRHSHICTGAVRLLGLLGADQLKHGTQHRTKSDPADEKEGRPAKRDSRDNEQVSFRRYNCSKCLRIVVRRYVLSKIFERIGG